MVQAVLEVMNRIPQRFNALMSRLLGAATLMPNELVSRAVYLPTQEKPTTSKTNPQTEIPTTPNWIGLWSCWN